MAQRVANIETYIHGPDGNGDEALLGTIRAAIVDAQKESPPIDRIQCEVRVKPEGSDTSSQESMFHFDVQATPETIVSGIQQRLERSPGDTFAGELRLNFRSPGNSKIRFGSYTRTLSPDGMGEGYAEEYSETYDAARPWVDQSIRIQHANAERDMATAAIVREIVGLVAAVSGIFKAPGGDGGGTGILGDLVRGAVGIATDAGSPAAAAVKHGGGALASFYRRQQATGAQPPGPTVARHLGPPSPLGHAPGLEIPTIRSPSAPPDDGISHLQAETWARQNPEAARAMGIKLMGEGL